MIPKIWFSTLFLLSFASLVVAQNKPDGKTLFEEGKIIFDQGDFAKAIPTFESAAAAFQLEKQYSQQVEAMDYQARCVLFSGDTESAMVLYKQAFDLAQDINDKKAIANIGAAIAETNSIKGKHQEALSYMKTINPYNLELKDWDVYANGLTSIGFNYLALGQLDSAKLYMEKSLRLKESLDQPKDLVLNYYNLAALYSRLGEADQAFQYHLKAVQLLEINKDSSQLVVEYQKISELFLEQDNLEKAEEYAQKSVNLANTLQLGTYRALALNNLARLKDRQGADQEALALYKEALDVYIRFNNFTGMVMQQSGIGNIYLRQGSFELAEKYFSDALVMSKERAIPSEQSDLYLNLALSKLKQNKPDPAWPFLDSAKVFLPQIQQPDITLKYHRLVSQYYEQKGQYQKALEATKLANTVKDSLYNIEKSTVIHELGERYERVKKDKEITELNAENDLKDLRLQQSKRTLTLTLIGLVLAGGIVVLLYFFNRLRRRVNEKLAEKNTVIAKSLAEKEILLKEIHHRVKNNLQVVSSLLRLQTKYIEDEKALDAIQEGRNRVKSMAMIHQNLYREDNLTGITVNEYIQKLSESLFHSYNISPDRIHLTTDIDALNLDVDTVIPLGLILNELLTNALKYAFPDDQQGEVSVTLKQESEYLMLEVKDNGVGMSPMGGAKPQGGFGLKLIDTFAQKLQAKLLITQDEGTSVRLFIHQYKVA